MKLLLLSLILVTNLAFADVPQLVNLSSSDVDAISKEFASNFVHTIAAPASSYGKLFGFEVGVLVGETKSPNIQRITHAYDPTSNLTIIPTAGLVGGVSGPLGLGGELSYIPKVTSGGVSIQNISGAVKWTCTDLIPTAPINFAVRVHGSSSTLSYGSVVNNVTATVAWKNTSTGYNVELSKKFLMIEPYAGFGSVTTKTDIGVSAATPVQIFTFTTATDYIANNSGSHYYAGLNLNLLLFKVSAEYAKIMGVTKMVGKLSFYF